MLGQRFLNLARALAGALGHSLGQIGHRIVHVGHGAGNAHGAVLGHHLLDLLGRQVRLLHGPGELLGSAIGNHGLAWIESVTQPLPSARCAAHNDRGSQSNSCAQRCSCRATAQASALFCRASAGHSPCARAKCRQAGKGASRGALRLCGRCALSPGHKHHAKRRSHAAAKLGQRGYHGRGLRVLGVLLADLFQGVLIPLVAELGAKEGLGLVAPAHAQALA